MLTARKQLDYLSVAVRAGTGIALQTGWVLQVGLAGRGPIVRVKGAGVRGPALPEMAWSMPRPLEGAW